MTRVPPWTGFAGKTLWNWLELLVIPLALAAVAFGLNYFANERDQRREDQRAARERAIAADGRREDALRVYLQQMSGLMLDRDLWTRRPSPEVRAVARTFTLTVLRRLDPVRKGLVVRFLAQAGLIGPGLPRGFPPVAAAEPAGPGDPPIGREDVAYVYLPRTRTPKVDLTGADLRDVQLRGVDLIGRSLKGADLRGADLREADLVATTFDEADLRDADLSGARMGDLSLGIPIANELDTSFALACVTGARFVGADMSGLRFEGIGWNVDFSHANLERAVMRTNLSEVKLEGTKQARADLPSEHWKMPRSEIDRLCRLSVTRPTQP